MPPKPLLLQAPSLAAIPWLRHAFTTRHGGATSVYGRPHDLNLGLTPDDDPAQVQQNRRLVLDSLTPPRLSLPLITARQTHSTIVRTIEDLPAGTNEADALLTHLPAVFLGILTADCVPILLVDTRLRIVAAIHAGWRGTAGRIAQKTLQTMHHRYQTRPEDIHAAIGPSIGPCCYQVGQDLRDHFPAGLFHEDRLDLWHANRLQLLASGLPPTQIETLGQCTACALAPSGDRLFFSHRVDHGRTGRMMAIIGLADANDPLA